MKYNSALELLVRCLAISCFVYQGKVLQLDHIKIQTTRTFALAKYCRKYNQYFIRENYLSHRSL